MRIDAQDIKGKKFSLNLKEWQARIFQHEYDHLEVLICTEGLQIGPFMLN